MVKTTYALTLFVAVSLAAPIHQAGSGNFIGAGTEGGEVNDVVKGILKELTPRGESEKSGGHGNLIDELPIVGQLLGNSAKQSRSITGGLSNIPLLGELLGGDQAHRANTPNKEARSHMPFGNENHGQNYGQNYGQNAGQNAHQNEGQNAGQNYGQNAGQNHGQNKGQNYLQNYGQNHGQNEGQNYGQNHRRGMDAFGPLGESSLAQTIPETATDSSAAGFRAGLEAAESLTSFPVAGRGMSEKIQEIKSDGPNAFNDANAASKAQDLKKSNKPNKPAKANPLAQLASESGLAALFGTAHHGVGILPMNGRRDTTLEARGGAPIEGSTLTDVLFSSGPLGKLTHTLSPQSSNLGQSDSPEMGDGGIMAGPGQPGSPAGSAAAGPHDGPGYVALHQKHH
ncbi:hypothetical protein N7490_002424 [Penicillium lividum]|nr:hypothetical protein N7490_002424 [Penicillium lividum]